MNLEDINPEELASADFTDTVNDRAEMEEAIKQLTKEQQTVITLRIIRGYSVSVTARLMHKKEGAIRVIQYRALKELAKIIDGEGK